MSSSPITTLLTALGQVRQRVWGRRLSLWVLGFLPAIWVGYACIGYAQKPFREYVGIEYDDFPVPRDSNVQGEYVWGRLKYQSTFFGRGIRQPQPWSMDYPRCDRHVVQGLKRLTRINIRSVEQAVDFDDDMYHWPFLYAVEVGYWNLSDAQAAKLRDYLLRGGFFMVDDFHGTEQWSLFERSLSKVFPDRPVVELENADPVFHTVYDLDERFQVPGEASWFRTGQTFEMDGIEPRWRGIFDDKGRLMVAICHNMDLGDAWEHSDNPKYPEKFASLAYRLAVNYVTYAMTH